MIEELGTGLQLLQPASINPITVLFQMTKKSITSKGYPDDVAAAFLVFFSFNCLFVSSPKVLGACSVFSAGNCAGCEEE
jgi:hypothetical protein